MKANANGTPEKFDVIFSSIVNLRFTFDDASIQYPAARNAIINPIAADIALTRILLIIDC
jgi:hypothetical protein